MNNNLTTDQKYDIQKEINDMKETLMYLDCEDPLEKIIEMHGIFSNYFNKLETMYIQFTKDNKES